MARPEQVDVWVGLDVGKEDHFAGVLDDAGERIFARGAAGDEAALEALICLARRRCDVILAMLTTRQPCQPARTTHRREIADAA